MARPETDGASEMTRYSPGRSALLWNAHNAAFGLLARRGVPVRRVRYEQFLADPRAGLRQLAAFAGLDLCTDRPGSSAEAHADLRSGTAPPATRCASRSAGCRCAATTRWVTRACRARQRRLVGAVVRPAAARVRLPGHGSPARPVPGD